MTAEKLSHESNPSNTLIKNLTASWLERLTNRKRKPCKPATISLFSYYVASHINPLIGDLEVETFQNKQLKVFADALVAKELAPKTIHELVGVVQQIIKSAQDENGNTLYVRNWNREFVLEGVPDIRDQRQPMITKEQLKEALKVRHTHTDKYRIIITLLAASGIRIGELVALRCGDDGEHSGWDQEKGLLAIRSSLWNGKEQKPKTLSSIRLVDLSQPVNAMLATYVQAAGKKSGDFLFSTSKGTALRPESLRKLALDPLGIPGFHSLRRWRVSYLKSIGTPESLLKSWIGHSSGSDITARYDFSGDDKEWRKSWSNRVGIGFELPTPARPTAVKPKPAQPTSPRKPSWKASARAVACAQKSEAKRQAALAPPQEKSL